MPEFVHVARILPGKTEEFRQRVKQAFEAMAPALKEAGFTGVRSFTTPETTSDGGGLLVTVYECSDASVVQRFYQDERVLAAEALNHGVLVAPHDHDAVLTNAAFLDLDLS
ncbi:MAG TPA: hypothetical protein VFO59_10815 [Dehalococcoidia bacterium]|jgi:hypothetical protein|nr:hypothetical protein [Dehalococcoidia bacterium]